MAAGIFHVYTHSVWAAPALFHDEIDYTTFLRELARTTARTEWDCIAFCAIDTHYHLIVEVDDGVLPKGMHALNFRYAMQFNERHALKGHVMGARYDAVRIDDEDHLVTAFRYVVRNPLEAGLRNGAARLAVVQLLGHRGPGRAALLRRLDPSRRMLRRGALDGHSSASGLRRRVVTELF
jgi:REP element-mobilizing transposase RayT